VWVFFLFFAKSAEYMLVPLIPSYAMYKWDKIYTRNKWSKNNNAYTNNTNSYHWLL